MVKHKTNPVSGSLRDCWSPGIKGTDPQSGKSTFN